jgi:tryptophanyl-tRNA synthetase
MFSGEEEVKSVYTECTRAERGCVDCKKHLAGSLNRFLEPIRDRRIEFEKRPGLVKEILEEGCKTARRIAQDTIEEVYQKMGLA